MTHENSGVVHLCDEMLPEQFPVSSLRVSGYPTEHGALRRLHNGCRNLASSMGEFGAWSAQKGTCLSRGKTSDCWIVLSKSEAQTGINCMWASDGLLNKTGVFP